MDEKVDKALHDALDEDDYEMVLRMLNVLERSSRGQKDEIRRILEETIDE